MNKDIINKNAKGKLHGYNERYWGDKLWYKCFYNNGGIIDYEEFYYSGEELHCKSFYI